MRLRQFRLLKYFVVIYMALFLAACGGSSRVSPAAGTGLEKGSFESTIETLNSRLQSDPSLSDRREYRLGVGDSVDVSVFLVDDLSRIYQVNSQGNIQMPLVGGVPVAGLTIVEAQEVIKESLGREYLRNPQVTLTVAEYSSNEIFVTGAVKAPKAYVLKQGRNPFEILTLAGGLSEKAGSEMRLTTKARNEQTGQFEAATTIVDLNSILNPETQQDFENINKVKNIILTDGDTLDVPSAGKVYVDGAVKRPGVYEISQDNTTILSLITLAGGAKWESSSRNVKVVRKQSRNRTEEFNINLDRIRDNKDNDFILKSGDLVLVGKNAIRSGLRAFWEYGLRLIFLF